MSWAFAPLEKNCSRTAETVPGQLSPAHLPLRKPVNGEVSQIGVIVMNLSLF